MGRFLAITMLAPLAVAVAAAGANPDDLPPLSAAVRNQAKKSPPLAELDESANDNADLQRSLTRLKAERERLRAESGGGAPRPELGWDGDGLAKLQARLHELQNKVVSTTQAKQPGEPKTVGQPQPPAKDGEHGADHAKPKPALEQPPLKAGGPDEAAATKPLDAVGLAHALFRGGNYEQALKIYRLINLSGLTSEERVPLRYLTATCLLKLGKLEEATTLYREVANARDDKQVAECAQWQLGQLQWRAEFQARMKDLRDRCKALGVAP